MDEPEILIPNGGEEPPEQRYSPSGRIGIRFLALFGLIFFTLWFAVALALFLISGLLHLVTLGRLESLPSMLRRQWGAVCFGLACMVAGVVALFSPRFGLGIALLYLVILAERGESDRFTEQFRSRFQTAYHRF